MSNQSWAEALVTAGAAGTALTAAATTSCLPTHAVYTLPPNFFDKVGKKLRIIATGSISCAVTTPGTARWDVRFGSVTVFDTLAMNLNIVAKVNVHWLLDLHLTCRSIGSGTSATLMGQGTWTSEAVIASPLPTVGGSGVLTVPYNTAPAVGTGWDSTASQVVDLRFTQTAATGSMTLHTYELISCN